MKKFMAALLSLSFLTFACGGEDKEESTGNLTLHLHLEPSPARVGQARLHIHVQDAEGGNVENAALEVVPWMPSHGHGSPETPKVIESGAGMYEAFPITFSMPGPWEIRVKAKAGGEHGAETLEVDVAG